MATAKTTLRIAASLAFALAAATAAPAAEEPAGGEGGDTTTAPAEGQPWSILLRQQLQREKGCSVLEILTANEEKLGDETILDGKVSCVDGRQFDFMRRREHQKFELRMCEPAVC